MRPDNKSMAILVRKIRRIIFLLVLFSASICNGETSFFEDFSANYLAPSWKICTSRKADKITVDSKSQTLLLESQVNRYNYIARSLPADLSLVQCDINNVNDSSASWSPSLIVYWNRKSYIRVMSSLHYGLQIRTCQNGRKYKFSFKNKSISPGEWYRVRIEFKSRNIEIFFGLRDKPLELVKTLKTKDFPSSAGTLILGKGAMPADGRDAFKNDFDFAQNEMLYSCCFDNIVINHPTGLKEKLAKSISVSQADAAAFAPEKLLAAVWPNVMRKETEKTIWLTQGILQPLCLLYHNLNKRQSIGNVALDIECSEGLVPRDIISQLSAKLISNGKNGDLQSYTVKFPDGQKIPAGFHGRDINNPRKAGWLRTPVRKPIYLTFRPDSQKSGILKIRLRSNDKPGPWTVYKVVVLPPLQPAAEKAFITIWGGSIFRCFNSESVETEILKGMRQAGVGRLVALDTRKIALALKAGRAAGLKVFRSQWWPYSRQCPAKYIPAASEKATAEKKASRCKICPEIIAAGTGIYGKFLEVFKKKMTYYDFDGFMLDYETGPPACYCSRCRDAFKKFSGLHDVNWPADVRRKGKYYKQWIDFRCEQGARYAKIIAETIRQVKPGAPVYAWIAGYNYANTRYTHNIDLENVLKYISGVEVPEYTLPGTRPVKETLKRIMRSIDTIDKSIKHSHGKPVIYCASIAYPVLNRNLWSNLEMMNAQITAIIGCGVHGLSFWGDNIGGGVDGRFLHKIAEWNKILNAAMPFFTKGERNDAAVKIFGSNYRGLVKTVWVSGKQAIVFISNFTNRTEILSFSGTPVYKNARLILSNQTLNLKNTLTLKPFGAVVVIMEKE